MGSTGLRGRCTASSDRARVWFIIMKELASRPYPPTRRRGGAYNFSGYNKDATRPLGPQAAPPAAHNRSFPFQSSKEACTANVTHAVSALPEPSPLPLFGMGCKIASAASEGKVGLQRVGKASGRGRDARPTGKREVGIGREAVVVVRRTLAARSDMAKSASFSSFLRFRRRQPVSVANHLRSPPRLRAPQDKRSRPALCTSGSWGGGTEKGRGVGG